MDHIFSLLTFSSLNRGLQWDLNQSHLRLRRQTSLWNIFFWSESWKAGRHLSQRNTPNQMLARRQLLILLSIALPILFTQTDASFNFVRGLHFRYIWATVFQQGLQTRIRESGVK
jgi:hypothetical protein